MKNQFKVLLFLAAACISTSFSTQSSDLVSSRSLSSIQTDRKIMDVTFFGTTLSITTYLDGDNALINRYLKGFQNFTTRYDQGFLKRIQKAFSQDTNDAKYSRLHLDLDDVRKGLNKSFRKSDSQESLIEAYQALDALRDSLALGWLALQPKVNEMTKDDMKSALFEEFAKDLSNEARLDSFISSLK